MVCKVYITEQTPELRDLNVTLFLLERSRVTFIAPRVVASCSQDTGAVL